MYNDAIICTNVSFTEIIQVFQREFGIRSAIYSRPMHLIIIIKHTESFVPANLLGDHRVTNGLKLQCHVLDNNPKEINIHPEAFLSSQNTARILHIESCDVRALNFVFLEGFHKLREICISNSDNFRLIDWNTLPFLPNLYIMVFTQNNGLQEWKRFPMSAKKLREINLNDNRLGDISMDRVLIWFLDLGLNDTLEYLFIENNQLTQIPGHMFLFTKLKYLNFKFNSLRRLISGSFVLHSHLILNLEWNEIDSIEPGAFQGFFSL